MAVATVATVAACSGASTRETEGTTNVTMTPQMTSSDSTGGSSGTSGTPTTGDVSTSGSGGATTGTTEPAGSSTGDSSSTSAGSSTGGSSTGSSTGSSSTGEPPPTCGDGVVDVGEACDAGGESKDCNADCTAAACGDGQLNVSAGEACDAGGESVDCNADCTAAACGDGKVNMSAGEACDGKAPANASCDACDVACVAGHDNCNDDLGDGCEIDIQSDAKHCGACDKACPNNVKCVAGKCVDAADAFHKYDFEGRTVYLFKTTQCADLNQHTTYCENKGLAWWKAKSQADAQKLIDVAFSLDQWHTWIQVFGAKTDKNGLVEGFNVVVDGPGCVDSSPDGWTAFRKWACSFCEPTNQQSQSCCWDKDHLYDWFVCQG